MGKLKPVLALELGLDRATVERNITTRAHVLVEVIALGVGPDGTRPPLSVVFAVDVSGSMAGPPLEHVVRSIDRLLEQLGPEDAIGVVAFSDAATEVVPFSPVDPETRRLVRTRLQRLKAHGATHVEAGLLRARGLLPERKDRGRQVVLLLSDGGPNRGAMTPATLREIVQKMRPDVSISSLGYGPNHHEDVLGAISDAGGGRYYFVPDPATCQLQFAQALGAQGDVVAEGLELVLAPAEGVEIARLLGGRQGRVSPRGLLIPLPDAVDGRSHIVAAELAITSGLALRSTPVLRATLRYRRAGLKINEAFDTPLAIEVTEKGGALVAGVHKKVLLARIEEARAEARAMADRGQFEGAATTLRAMIAEVEKAPEFVASDGSPLAEALEILIDDASAMKRKPDPEQYKSFRRSQLALPIEAARSLIRAGIGAREKAAVDASAGLFPKAHLVANDGRMVLLKSSNIIGRTPAADVQVPTKDVSRQHANVFAIEGEFWVADLGSTNTTRVNGKDVDTRKLQDGDVIELGGVRLIYREEQELATTTRPRG